MKTLQELVNSLWNARASMVMASIQVPVGEMGLVRGMEVSAAFIADTKQISGQMICVTFNIRANQHIPREHPIRSVHSLPLSTPVTYAYVGTHFQEQFKLYD